MYREVISKVGHDILDFWGLIPGIGEPADVANGLWYYCEGNYVDGSLSIASESIIERE